MNRWKPIVELLSLHPKHVMNEAIINRRAMYFLPTACVMGMIAGGSSEAVYGQDDFGAVSFTTMSGGVLGFVIGGFTALTWPFAPISFLVAGCIYCSKKKQTNQSLN
jgi:hypothetical protein